MLEPEPPRGDLLSRSEVRAAGAAVVGGIVGGLIVLIIFLMFGGDDGDNGDEQAVTTPPAATATQPPDDGATPQPSAAPTVTGTPAGPTDPEEALEAFIGDEFGEPLIGDCPQEVPPGGVPDGYCSVELHLGDELASYLIGPAFTEGAGEAVLTRRPDRSWDVRFVPAPPLGEQIAVGQEAMVYGVGSCLNFRAEPNSDADGITCQLDGTSAVVVEGPVEQETDTGTITWWRLEGLGWGSGQFLARTP
jgi:hypothetical protein